MPSSPGSLPRPRAPSPAIGGKPRAPGTPSQPRVPAGGSAPPGTAARQGPPLRPGGSCPSRPLPRRAGAGPAPAGDSPGEATPQSPHMPCGRGPLPGARVQGFKGDPAGRSPTTLPRLLGGPSRARPHLLGPLPAGHGLGDPPACLASRMAPAATAKPALQHRRVGQVRPLQLRSRRTQGPGQPCNPLV